MQKFIYFQVSSTPSNVSVRVQVFVTAETEQDCERIATDWAKSQFGEWCYQVDKHGFPKE